MRIEFIVTSHNSVVLGAMVCTGKSLDFLKIFLLIEICQINQKVENNQDSSVSTNILSNECMIHLTKTSALVEIFSNKIRWPKPKPRLKKIWLRPKA